MSRVPALVLRSLLSTVSRELTIQRKKSGVRLYGNFAKKNYRVFYKKSTFESIQPETVDNASFYA